MLVTQSVLPSGATPMPCEGAVARPASVSNSTDVSGSLILATSLRAAKSTTANPLVSESCTKMRLVDPSGPASIVIGRTPRSNGSSQIGTSRSRSMKVKRLAGIEPAMRCLPSGVVDVVQPALDQDALGPGQRLCVDDVDG